MAGLILECGPSGKTLSWRYSMQAVRRIRCGDTGGAMRNSLLGMK